jgi:hypothetical protein
MYEMSFEDDDTVTSFIGFKMYLPNAVTDSNSSFFETFPF